MSLDYDQNFLQDHLLSDFDWGTNLTGDATKKEADCFEIPMSNLMSDVSDDWLDPCGGNLHLGLDSPPLTPEDHEEASLQQQIFPLDLEADFGESFQYSAMDTNALETCSMSYQPHNIASSFLTTQTNTTTSNRNDDITLALIKATQDAEMSVGAGGGNPLSTINCDEINFENLSVPAVAKSVPAKSRKSKAGQRRLNASFQAAKERMEKKAETECLQKELAIAAEETQRLIKIFSNIAASDESSSFCTDTIENGRDGREMLIGSHFQAKVDGGMKRVGSRTTQLETPQLKKSCSVRSITTTAATPLKFPLKSVPIVKLKRITKQPVIASPTSTVFAMSAKNTIQIPINTPSSASTSVNGNPPSSIVNLTTTNSCNGVKSYIVAAPSQQSNKNNVHPIIHLPTADAKMCTSSNDVPLLSVITHSDPSKPKLVSTVDRRVSTIKIEPGVKPVFLLPQNPKIAIVKQPASISPPPTSLNDAAANTEQQMYKLIPPANTSQQQQQSSKPVVLSNYMMNNNATKTTNADQDGTQSQRSKPLMGSLAGRKKPIVPAPIALEATINNSTSTLTLSQLQSPTPELKIETSGDIDRMYKRQQRMIKNRESASQSRQRRKQHVMDLEQQLSEMKDENFKLRLENKRLLDENRSFRRLLSAKNISIDGNPKKKSLMLLSLLLMMAFTFTSFGPFVPNNNSGSSNPPAVLMDHNLPLVIDSAASDSTTLLHHSRQLLSFGEGYQDSGNVSSGKKEESSSDVVRTTTSNNNGGGEEFWIDDVVKNYKKESLERILELLRGTSSIPLQRLLRRKLKEELGIRVPLFPTKLRRISSQKSVIERLLKVKRQAPPRSTPIAADVTPPPTSSRIPSAYRSFEQEKVKMPPPPPPRVKHSARGFHHRQQQQQQQQAFPCAHPSSSEMNETETSRLNSKLDWWISHHEVNRQEQADQQETHLAGEQTKNNQQKKPKKKRRKTRSRKRSSTTVSSRLLSADTPRKENGLAVYTKKNDMSSFWEAFGRQNDTIYVISMRKDQMLLPPLVRNLSSKTKLSLLLSAAPPNDTFANEDEFMTMIKIDCEVNSSDYLRIRRDILPKDFDKYASFQNSEHDGEKKDEGDPGDIFTALTYNNDEEATVADVLEP